ncbi:MAG TPA: NAD-dependent epimerase/dehydratase family protein [Chitinophagales bacterium]|nr:NAD-dependent epimerase/dehydratase family protein [Chitinophagales bacterium]
MKILITGITGLIGNHLMQVLLRHGYNDIRGNYFSNRNLDEYISQNIEMIQADIADERALHNITKDCEVVVHTAARVIDFGTKKQFYEAHYDATSYLLKDAKANHVKHFIYVSSVGVASGIVRNKVIPDETTPLVKTGVHYDDAKIDTETLVKDFCTQNNMIYTIIRPSAVIGKGSVWVLEPLKRIDTALGLKLIDNGKQPACLLDAENLATGIFLCITKEIAKNQTYFFMDDWNISWKQYFTDLAAMKGKKIGSSIPFWLAYSLASFAEFIFPLFGKNPPIAKKSAQATGRNRLVSTKKAQAELGWKSLITYEESMRRIKESLV